MCETMRDKEYKGNFNFTLIKNIEKLMQAAYSIWLSQAEGPSSTFSYTLCPFLELNHLSFTVRSLTAILFTFNNINSCLRNYYFIGNANYTL